MILLLQHTVLLLPGKTLHISALLTAKTFRDKGNKEGAVRAINLFESAGLGEVEEIKPQGELQWYEHAVNFLE